MITESSLNRCWEKSMKLFIEKAKLQNICAKEYMVLNDFAAQINNYKLDEKITEKNPWKKQSQEYYVKQVDSPGRYSEMCRLYSYGYTKINQYEYIIQNIRKRRNIKPIVIPIYDPYKDNRRNVTTPCISTIVFDIINGAINMYVNYTTINLFRMGLFDFTQMAFLHTKIAEETEFEIGKLCFFSVQAYMPVFDYIFSEKIFKDDEEGRAK